MSNHDAAGRPAAERQDATNHRLDRNAFDDSTSWMINEVGANTQARSAHEALRTREGEVLEQWSEGLGVVSKAELSGLVRTAHSIRDALRPEQVGEQHGPL
jgi:YD repeat-containing protein